MSRRKTVEAHNTDEPAPIDETVAEVIENLPPPMAQAAPQEPTAQIPGAQTGPHREPGQDDPEQPPRKTWAKEPNPRGWENIKRGFPQGEKKQLLPPLRSWFTDT
jgi:hypothetical protein